MNDRADDIARGDVTPDLFDLLAELGYPSGAPDRVMDARALDLCELRDEDDVAYDDDLLT